MSVNRSHNLADYLGNGARSDDDDIADETAEEIHPSLFDTLKNEFSGDLRLCVKGDFIMVDQHLFVQRSNGYQPPENMEEVLDGIDKQTLVYFLQYVYSDTYPNPELPEHVELLECADFLKQIASLAARFKMDTLLTWAENIMAAQINTSNLTVILGTAFAHNLQRLKQICIHKIACCKYVANTKEWADLYKIYPTHCKETLDYIAANEKDIVKYTNLNVPDGSDEEEDEFYFEKSSKRSQLLFKMSTPKPYRRTRKRQQQTKTDGTS